MQKLRKPPQTQENQINKNNKIPKTIEIIPPQNKTLTNPQKHHKKNGRGQKGREDLSPVLRHSRVKKPSGRKGEAPGHI